MNAKIKGLLLLSFMLFPLIGYTQEAAQPTMSGSMQQVPAHVAPSKITGNFQILSVGARIGVIRFIPTGVSAQSEKPMIITVDAGSGGDVEAAIIGRIIVIIRDHFKENFNWNSHRLGRIVVLSARPEDEASLERFLLAEFFSITAMKPAGQ